MNRSVTIWLICLSTVTVIFFASCIFLPKTVQDEETKECVLVTKSLTIDYYTDSEMIQEAVDEMFNALTSDCHEPECLILLAPFITISAGSFIITGSIVVVGNTIHWVEEQGRCNDSVTRQTVNSLTKATKKLGGHVINTSNELIEWFRMQANQVGTVENVDAKENEK